MNEGRTGVETDRDLVVRDSTAHAVASRWPYRLAWLLACVTFPLIWVGGLVTTYGAGMAVPDWPNTYGYNLFLYPLESWLHVWDVFLEHSHRLIGATAGMVTILLAGALLGLDRRAWMKWMGLLAVLGVSLQGLLGGLRVIQNEVLLADVHGCTAPAFFALCAALVAWTSPTWQAPATLRALHPKARYFQRLAWITTAGLYLQIVLGAQVRHLPIAAGPEWLAFWIYLHLAVAGLDLVCVLGLWQAARSHFAHQPMLVRRAWWLLGVFVLQATLGALTWVSKYGVPGWFNDYVWHFEYTVAASGRLRAALVTAHVGVGSLTLVTAVSLALWSMRLLRGMEAVPRASEATGASAAGRGRLVDYWHAARPRIVAMVLFTMAVAALVSDRSIPPAMVLLHALGGSALVIVGAIVLNQLLEHQSDAAMPRTRLRPLPSGQLSDTQAMAWGLSATIAGLGWLAWQVNGPTVLLALVSWAVYVWVYTPLKLFTAWQTPIGAVAGAMPVLLGAAATEAALSPVAWSLFGVLYFWQFPHAMAIAWLRREDFAKVDLRVATVVDPSGRMAGWMSLASALILAPVSLIPSWLGAAGWGYTAAAVLLSLAYLAASGLFLFRRDDSTARRLLRVSLVYLPILLVALAVSTWF